MSADQFAAIAVPMSAPAVEISLRQVGALLAFLRDRGEPTIYLATASHRIDIEVAVRRWSLASLTAPFDHDPAVIAVVDEAQFHGANVRVWREDHGDAVMMGFAPSSDGPGVVDAAMTEIATGATMPAREAAIC